jgi:hypothetical protein
MPLLREIYLSLVFVVGIGAALGPYLLGTGSAFSPTKRRRGSR